MPISRPCHGSRPRRVPIHVIIEPGALGRPTSRGCRATSLTLVSCLVCEHCGEGTKLHERNTGQKAAASTGVQGFIPNRSVQDINSEKASQVPNASSQMVVSLVCRTFCHLIVDVSAVATVRGGNHLPEVYRMDSSAENLFP